MLDVKVGRGAFIKEYERARQLAVTMVNLGADHGVATVAQLTSMDAPLGRAVGNALEVTESVEVLRGGGPDDVRALALALARRMVELVHLDVDPEDKLNDGSAYELYCRMIRAQGGNPEADVAVATHRATLTAPRAGVVQSVDAFAVGVGAWRLGAGRARKEDPVSAGAGVVCQVREGDVVAEGDLLFDLYADDDGHLARGRVALIDACVIGDEPIVPTPLLIDFVEK